MKTISKALGALWVALFLVPGAQALPISFTDAWDVSQGTVVTAHSGVLSGGWSSDARNMFGGSFGSGPVDVTSNTIFNDYESAGALHWVQWRTASPIMLTGFNLVAAHDSGGFENRNINYRGFRTFTLYSGDGLGNWTSLFAYTADPDSDLDYGGGVTYPAQNMLELTAGLAPVLAQYFRADFVQYGTGSSFYGDAQGPRVVELDALVQRIPEPGTLMLLGVGLAALAGALRRRR